MCIVMILGSSDIWREKTHGWNVSPYKPQLNRSCHSSLSTESKHIVGGMRERHVHPRKSVGPVGESYHLWEQPGRMLDGLRSTLSIDGLRSTLSIDGLKAQ